MRCSDILVNAAATVNNLYQIKNRTVNQKHFTLSWSIFQAIELCE